MAATIAPTVFGVGAASPSGPFSGTGGVAAGAGTVPTSGGPCPGASSCPGSVESGGEAATVAHTRSAASAMENIRRRVLMTIGPGTSRAGSDPGRLHGADPPAGLLQVGHLLRVAQADQLPAVLRVGIERRAGDDRDPRALEDRAGRLLVVLEAEVAELGEHVIGPLRRVRLHARLAAGLHRHIALHLVVTPPGVVVRRWKVERLDHAVLQR